MYTGGGLLLACAGCGLLCERALLATGRRARLAELEAEGYLSLGGGALGATPAAAAPSAEGGAEGAEGAEGGSGAAGAAGAETESGRAEGAEGAQGEGRLPLGLLLVVLGAAQAERLALLPGHRALCVCGVPQDIKVWSHLTPAAAPTLALTLSLSLSLSLTPTLSVALP